MRVMKYVLAATSLSIAIVAIGLSSAVAQEDIRLKPETLSADEMYGGAQIIENIDQLLEIHDSRVKDLIPILVPDASYRQSVDLGLVVFSERGFSDSFINTLAKHGGVEYAKSSVVVYPIFIRRSRSGAYILETENYEEATSLINVNPAKDWDKFWYAKQHFAKYFPDQKISRRVFWHFHSIHNELRVEGWIRLVTLEGKNAIDEYEEDEQLLREAEIAAMPVMMTMSGDGPPANFQFSSIGMTTNNTTELTLIWPSGCLTTNRIDLFACTNLMNQNWSIVQTMNVNLSSNTCSWVDVNSTNYTRRFYDCWTLSDTDGDGISDGREERIYGTDKDDIDTDDDGLSDGTELDITETDPVDCDSDSDGLVDGYDGYRLATSYLNGVDADSDGYVDGEYDFGTDPDDTDSDDDSFEDGFEVACGSDPTNAASFPATLSGTISYSGGQTGDVNAIAVESSISWDDRRLASISAPGAYTISNVPTLKSYWLKAYRDSNGNGIRDAWEALGEYVSNSVSVVTNTTGLNIALSDPDLDGDGMYDWQEQAVINSDTNDAIETVDHLLEWEDFDGDGVSNGDEIALGTDPNDSSSVPPVMRFSESLVSVTETASNAVVSIDLLPAASGTVQIMLSVTGGSANNGTDYTFTNQLVTFSAGETNKQISVTIFTDNPREPTEQIIFNLSGISGAAVVGQPEQMTVFITDSFSDSDSDGLPDAWEQQYFQNLNQTASGDPDGDGVSNLAEFKQGRHPKAGAVADTNNVLKLNVITPLR